MPFNLNHIAGYCLSIFKVPSNLITQILSLIILISFFRVLMNFLKVFLLRRKLVIAKTPVMVKELAAKHNLHDQILVIKDKKPNAFCLGLRKPAIYISNSLISLLSTAELEAVILHEKYHHRNHDTFWMFILSVIKEFFFFIPIISDFVAGIVRQKELLADRYSVKKLGGNLAIIQSFRKLITLQSPEKQLYDYIPSFAHIDTMEYRIKTLRGQNPALFNFRISRLVITFLFMALFLSLAMFSSNKSQASEKPTHTVCLKGEVCHVDCSSI